MSVEVISPPRTLRATCHRCFSELAFSAADACYVPPINGPGKWYVECPCCGGRAYALPESQTPPRQYKWKGL